MLCSPTVCGRGWGGGLSPVEEVFNAVYVEVEGEAEGLVKRVGLGRSDDISRVE